VDRPVEAPVQLGERLPIAAPGRDDDGREVLHGPTVRERHLEKTGPRADC
jgi:hypothetical protein